MTRDDGAAQWDRDLLRALGQRAEAALPEWFGFVAFDLFPDKIAFAKERLPRCRFVVGSVYELPFEDGAFDHVLVRDVIHHLDDPARFVGEVARVLSSGGRLDVLEPCRYNPLIFAHALAVRAERGELRSTPRFLKALLGPRFDVSLLETFQGLPLHRLVFHPDLGRPAWARIGAVKRVVDAIEHLADGELSISSAVARSSSRTMPGSLFTPSLPFLPVVPRARSVGGDAR